MEHNCSKFDPCPQKTTSTYQFDLKPLLIFEPAIETSLEIIFTAASKYKKAVRADPGAVGMMFAWDKSTDFTQSQAHFDNCKDLAQVIDQTVNRP